MGCLISKKIWQVWVKKYLLSEKISLKIGWFNVGFNPTLIFIIFKVKSKFLHVWNQEEDEIKFGVDSKYAREEKSG